MNDHQQVRASQSITRQRKNHYFLSLALILTLITSFILPVFQPPAYAAVETPVLLTPVSNATITAKAEAFGEANPPVAVPVFTWQPVVGATQYRIEFATNIGFSPIQYGATTPLTKFIPTSVSSFNDGQWYWRVRVESPIAGPYQAVPRSFTKQWASPSNKPLLVSPSNSATVEFFDAPIFSWEPVIGASSYHFQISTSPAFSNIVWDRSPITTTHQPEIKLSNATYYWRVIPLDPNNQAGTSSEIRSFNMGYNRVPTLLEPPNTSTPTFTPTFRWTATRGAQYYELWYSTDPNFGTYTPLNTRNTSFTPTTPLENDKNYYWKVRTWSGNSVSDWSLVWNFKKQWYIQPVLLTPVDGYQHVRFPTFNWTPVPGAAYYRFELDTDQDFVGLYISEETSNNFYTPSHYEGTARTWYWRVTPFDRNGKPGKESQVSSYAGSGDEVAPDQIYPYFYYPPNTFPAPDTAVAMHPYVDRTVSYPIFYWHRLTNPSPNGGTYAYGYRIEVSTSPLFSSYIVWSADTQNTHAAPTTGNPFVPVSGQNYYWHVRALNNLGALVGSWSQTWLTRITLPTPAGTTNPPQLVRPVSAAEIVETTPLFEWKPVTGATSYEVQINDYVTTVNTGSVPYPVYSPSVSLAQRLLGKINFGTYYWRVRAISGGIPGTWSEIRRFQIAAQSERLISATRTLGQPKSALSHRPDEVADNNYELTTLCATQDVAWYFANHTTAENMSYALYLDEPPDNSGGASDPAMLSLPLPLRSSMYCISTRSAPP
jgi:hypothetical protein